MTLLPCVLGVHTKQVENLRAFLLVCGLRRVKDPLYLLEAFAGIIIYYYCIRSQFILSYCAT